MNMAVRRKCSIRVVVVNLRLRQIERCAGTDVVFDLDVIQMFFILFNGLFRDFVQFNSAEQGEISGAHGKDDAVFDAAEILDGFLVFFQRLLDGGIRLAEIKNQQIEIDCAIVCADGVVVVVMLVRVMCCAGVADACGNHRQEVREDH